MLDISRLLRDGAIYAAAASLCVLLAMAWNPRLFLQDYPKAIQKQVLPKTPTEQRQSLLVGIPFLLILIAGPILSTLALDHTSGGAAPFLDLFLNAFGVAFAFNLIDLLALDWLLFCTLTPRFMVVPGTEGNPGYKDYMFHLRGAIAGTLISAVAGLAIAGMVSVV